MSIFPSPLAQHPLVAAATAVVAVGLTLAQDDVWEQEELERVSNAIQGEIETLRNQTFERPVEVRIATREEFVEYVTERMNDLQPPEVFAADESIAKHLGLVPADLDLLALTMDVLAEQVGGFYVPGEDTFYLMESFTGEVARIILAHELTHALDDQLYDIDGLLEDRVDRTDAATAFSAVVEGSGMTAMTRWMIRFGASLTAEDIEEATSIGTEAIGEAPPYVWKPLLGVYLRGQAFLEHGRRHLKKIARKEKREPDPNAAVRIAFESPPRSMEQVLHPEKYWSADDVDEPVAVELALDSLPDGWKVLRKDVYGELYVALFTTPIDNRESPDMTDPLAVAGLRYTNDASEGWAGDSLVLLGKDKARVLHWTTVWDTEDDAREFADAARASGTHVQNGLKVIAEGDADRYGMRVDHAGRVVTFVTWSNVADGEVPVIKGTVSR